MKAVISYYSILFSQKFILYEAITCSRLSDSGEDAKVKGTRKGQWRQKGNSFLPLYVHVHAFSNMRTGLSQRRVQKRELFRPEQSKGLGKLVTRNVHKDCLLLSIGLSECSCLATWHDVNKTATNLAQFF